MILPNLSKFCVENDKIFASSRFLLKYNLEAFIFIKVPSKKRSSYNFLQTYSKLVLFKRIITTFK